MNRVLFSSASPHWSTPQDVLNGLDEEFHFNLDPCPLLDSDWRDGTYFSWKGSRVFCNPPYGPHIGRWLEKYKEADLAVFLVPSRTDTKWWHDYAMKADEIRFIRGRLKFGNAANGAPFPSAILIYNNRK